MEYESHVVNEVLDVKKGYLLSGFPSKPAILEVTLGTVGGTPHDLSLTVEAARQLQAALSSMLQAPDFR